jgi:hypothetical protein
VVIAYTEVTQVKPAGLHKAAKIAIWSGVAYGGFLGAVYLGIALTGGLS